MTQEEKVKRYDEALHKAKNYYSTTDSSSDIKLIGLIFPELKESEDEKIRKELLNAFKEATDSLYVVLTPSKREAFIAWLEKQGEQNPAEWSEDNLPEFESYLCLMFQKFRTKGICTNGEIIDYVNEHSQKLKDILCHAWSEEDNKNLEKTVWYVEKGGKLIFQKTDKLMSWLKSLKDRYTWKPSDEQIKALNYVVNIMASSERPTENDLYYNILKSLRQQLKKLMEK